MVTVKGVGPTTIAVTASMLVALAVFAGSIPGSSGEILLSELQQGFYDASCPYAEEIVASVVRLRFAMDPGVAAGLIRLHFHDCFVLGCDASILLDKTPSGTPTEKFNLANLGSLYGNDLIDAIKSRIEEECPNTVSCADILAFAARDAAALSGLPSYPVPAGRRDRRISHTEDVDGNLPLPDMTVPTLTKLFAEKGFTQNEMVVLSGAHSIGGAHCITFSKRVYDHRPGQPQDPSMEVGLVDTVKSVCPKNATSLGAKIPLGHEGSEMVLDGKYYERLLGGKGLLRSDQALMQTKATRRLVRMLAENPHTWAEEFMNAMVKVGAMDVLVGVEGEIRTTCTQPNDFLTQY